MESPLISVIVPVYRAEAFLQECLDSIVNQTYRNLEIILVDDGSPDSCGKLCDEYAARDSRVKVIHKANGGVASARNAGLSAAAGDYIGWVDSDDWVEPDMFEALVRGALSYHADISVCGRSEHQNGNAIHFCFEEAAVLDREAAFDHLLHDKVVLSLLWNKLWRASLFAGISFPEGKNYEDLAVVYQLFLRADRLLCLPEIKYHYRVRTGSISHNTSLRNATDYFFVSQQRYLDVKDLLPQYRNAMERNCILCASHIWSAYFANPGEERRKYRPQIKEISDFCRQHPIPSTELSHLGLAARAVFPLTKYPRPWSFALARLISLLYRLRRGHEL